MTTIYPGSAELMPGFPRTEAGQDMPLASWYHLTPAAEDTEYVVVTGHAVYKSDSQGQVHDFFECIYQRPALGSQADALHHVGVGYELAVRP